MRKSKQYRSNRYRSKKRRTTKQKRRSTKHAKRTMRRMKGGACSPPDPARANDEMYMQQHKLCTFSALNAQKAT
jgi:hypothetical protein